MGFLVDTASSTISPGALMVLFLSDEMDTDLKLPEIFGLLGEEMTMKFLEIFGGRTFYLPPVKKVRRAYKIVLAHMKFNELREVNTEEDAAIQAGIELDMTSLAVRKAWARVGAMLERLEESMKPCRRVKLNETNKGS